jgi:hypothetical protein
MAEALSRSVLKINGVPAIFPFLIRTHCAYEVGVVVELSLGMRRV